MLIAVPLLAAFAVAVTLVPWGVPTSLWGARIETITVGDRTLRVVYTPDPGRGLAGIEDLGALDGMLFPYPEPNTPAPG